MSLSETFELFDDILNDIQPPELLNYIIDYTCNKQNEPIQEIRVYGLEYPMPNLEQEIQAIVQDFNEDPNNHDLLELQPTIKILPPDEDLREYLEHFFCQKFPQLQQIEIILNVKSTT